MIVCLCHGVSDREIRAARAAGCHTTDAIGQACGAGTCCGCCVDTIRELLAEVPAARLGGSNELAVAVVNEGLPASGLAI